MKEILRQTLDSDLYEAAEQVSFGSATVAILLTIQQMRNEAPVEISASNDTVVGHLSRFDGADGRLETATRDL